MMTGGKLASGLRNGLEVASTILVLIAAVAYLWNGARARLGGTEATETSVAVPSEPVPLDGAPMIGSQDARVALMEFADFQCPFCSRFASDSFPSLKNKYIDTGKVLFIFRHNPLPIHPRAEAAAFAAECAAQQRRFWELQHLLFANPKKLADVDLLGDAREAGLELDVFRACVANPPVERVKTDSELAKTLKLKGTPIFLLGRIQNGAVRVSQILVGAKPAGDFATALDNTLRVTSAY